MRKFFLLLFLLLVCAIKIQAQQKYIAMYLGGSRQTEKFFTEDSVGNYTAHPVFAYREDACFYFLREVAGWGFKTGIEFGHMNDSYKYPVDSSPLIFHHPTQNGIPCYCRLYDVKKELYEISIPFYVTHRFYVGNVFNLIPDAGVSLKFNIRDNYLAHTYLVDSTGITNPGPFTNYTSSVKSSNLFVPDDIFFAAHLAGTVRLSYRLSVAASVGIKFPLLEDKTISFPAEHAKFPVQIGLVYGIWPL